MRNFEAELVGLLPNLRAYARSLTGHPADADDLLQDTLVRLLGAADRFEPGTNFKAWAFTILRNRFLNEYVAKQRRTQPLHELDQDFAAVLPRQSDALELKDLSRVFMQLAEEHRSILSLALGARLPYSEIARIHGCATGTVKSRVHRARLALTELLAQAYAPGAEAADQPMATGNGEDAEASRRRRSATSRQAGC
jgi:RNA polymerase sigma-70 factor (ECF subfamily)